MRLSDLFRLALGALWQQKTRTGLTTLGVVLGCCMLTFSLSIGQGVHDALNRQFRKNDDLRRIIVYGGRGEIPNEESGVPPDALDVKGDMSEEKRARIRKMLLQQWHDFNTRRPPMPLSHDLIEQLKLIPHVDKVHAGFYEQGRLGFGDRSISASFRPSPTSQRGLHQQLVAGEVPLTDSSRSILVHEFLLYQLGIRDDVEVEKSIGKPVRIELFNHRRSPKALLFLFDAQATTLSNDEYRLLDKAVQQLPAALDKLDLSASERESLRQLLQRRDILSRPPEPLIVKEEFTLGGVFRDLTRDEEKQLPFHDRFFRAGEVVIPQATAKELCEKLPRRREEGFNSLTVVVDREENVREVVDDIKSRGLEHYSAVDLVEQVLRDIQLVRFVTTFIAAVALFVSGLGITNTMVTGVLERTQEIGIMKAVGARDRHIQFMFLIEGALLGVLGSAVGLLIAWALSIPGDSHARKIMEQQTKSAVDQQLFVFPAWLLLSVPFFVILVTTLAAIYPARRAARVDPIVALRHE